MLARDHTTRARVLHGEHRDPEALAACEAALKLVPTYAAAHRLRLDILLAQNKYGDVISSCDALLAQEKPSAELYELRGLARAGRRDYAGAIEDDTAAISLRPGSAPLLARRGGLYLATDAARLALRDFEEVIRLDPAYADAFLGRASARVRLHHYGQAVDDVEAALRLGKPSARMSYNAARVYCQAANAASTEIRKKGQDAVAQVIRYQDRAVELVQESLKRLPAEKRATFPTEALNDPDLSAIRRRLRSIFPAGSPVSPTGSGPKS
jgi:tetratricopeptide (TPR) repeat protein